MRIWAGMTDWQDIGDKTGRILDLQSVPTQCRFRCALTGTAFFLHCGPFFTGLWACVVKNSPGVSAWVKCHVAVCQRVAASVDSRSWPNCSPNNANSQEGGE